MKEITDRWKGGTASKTNRASPLSQGLGPPLERYTSYRIRAINLSPSTYKTLSVTLVSCIFYNMLMYVGLIWNRLMNALQSLIAYNDETFQSQKYTQTPEEEKRCPPMVSEFNSNRPHPPEFKFPLWCRPSSIMDQTGSLIKKRASLI